MVKTRVHDLAAEFGVAPEQLLSMLKDMNIFVRSHLSALESDQVSAVRVRWEREKRRTAEEPAVKKGRRKAAKAEPTPVAAEAKPAKRRRTAAEVAQAEAQVQAEKAAELAALELERPVLHEPEEPTTAQTLEERARALFKDLPPAPPESDEVEVATEEEPVNGGAPESPLFRSSASPPAAPRTPFIPPRVQRPTGPPAPRGPKPVFSSSAPPAPSRPAPGNRTGMPARPGPDRGAPPVRTFGPDAEKGGGRKKGKKGKRSSVDQEAVHANILRTLQGMKGPAGRKGRRTDEPSFREVQAGRLAEEREREKTLIRVNEFVSVSELASAMKVPATQIVQFAFKELGLMVTVNQRLDFDQIELIASAFGFQAVKEDEYAAETALEETTDSTEELMPRPPVVTIMGHVDHGKTSLLDYIRKANIVAGEAGGITQHIGAYHVELPGDKRITFLDTPGHQAFTAMRARGAQVTDIVVLVVAADDQVMPQTVEAISHARNAGVPIIVAINKIDLPTANVQKVKQDLLQHNVVLEEFGGTVLSAEISAKKGTGIDHLLEQILLQAEILDLKANPGGKGHGTVLEATLDPGKGPLATILVQRGTLTGGDNFICGKFSGRVRALYDERGKAVKAAGPSIPVQILGFEGVPAAGDIFAVVTDAVEARDIAQKRQRLEREAQNRRSAKGTSLEDFSRALKEGEVSMLRIIIKADQGGPAEALADALAQLTTNEVRVDVVHRGVGAITESDVLLAKASGAIVLGFHVRPDSNARAAAEREQVDVRTYRIIYEAVEDVRNALEGLLKPEERETVLGEAEVLQLFKVSKVGTIAGCTVRSGTIQRTAKARVIRDGTTVYTGALSSLKRFKDDVREVREGLECGIGIENFNDLKVGDRIESYRMEEIKRTLQPAASGAAG
ncbi:MAG TPA: translation initiation factor IF-2 [Gemmatimonadales bacterium]|nr:translation initiation factor IF-2 [Gemmatimonadales bacterium]